MDCVYVWDVPGVSMLVDYVVVEMKCVVGGYRRSKTATSLL